MGTNDLYSKEIGSAIGLGRLSRPAGGAISSGWQARRRQLLPVVADILMLVVASVATEALSHSLGDPAPPVSWVAFFGVLVIALFGARGMYSERLSSHLLDEIRSIVSTTAVATMAVISLRVVLADDPHTPPRPPRRGCSQPSRCRRAARGCTSPGPARSGAARVGAPR